MSNVTEMAKLWQAKITDETGFTVIELLAAMVVSSLLFGFVLSGYFFTQRVMLHSRIQHEVRENVLIYAERIMRDIESHDRPVRCDDTSLVLARWSQSSADSIHGVIYRFSSSSVTRNAVILGDPGIKFFVHASFVEDTSEQRATRNWAISLTAENGGEKDSVAVDFSVPIPSQELVYRSMRPGS